ncbi:MAG: putative pyrophosphohydrolase [Gaeavirus sp.]|uniref:Putative pyrophosphohydrolase n=1 Tax=Gaeavirus sp. TaxID=2487767 RepID=A0A3G5A1F5_9VIRU|nr:MAG: putative pyrophosphohydrolase [Gaeavirus sp.]
MSTYDNICVLTSEFNYLAGVINYKFDPETAVPNIQKFDSESKEFNIVQVKLRHSLIHEEIHELQDAIAENNITEIIDALCDILYVVAGARIYFNLHTNDDFQSRMENLILSKPTHTFNTETIKSILLNNELKLDLSHKLCLYSDLLNELTASILTGHNEIPEIIEQYTSILNNIVLNVLTFANMIDIDIYKLFLIVHSSNMTKFCLTHTDAESTITWYKEHEKRYTQPTYKQIIYDSKIYYVIYDNVTNKVLKSFYYIPVNFS